MKSLNVGLAQIDPTVGDFKTNTEKICSYIDSAEGQGLDLVVFPELSISGYPVWDLANKKRFIEEGIKSLGRIQAATKGKRVTAVVGFIDRADSKTKKSHNALAVLRNGKLIHKQYKTLLPTYDVFLEEIFFSPAETHRVFAMNGFRFGTSICEDIWDDRYAVKPAKILAQKGARILINISASPYHKEAVVRRREMVLRKAKDYGLWVIYVNQVGGQDDLVFDGRSFICDPSGRIRYEAEAFREALYRYQIHFGSGRENSFVLSKLHLARDMYGALVLGLRDYIRKNKFKKVAIGLSGGIDSALVGAIARDALGPEAVIGVGMPGPFSSPQSLRDAKTLAQNLGIQFRVRPIRSLYQGFIRDSVAEKTKRKAKAAEKSSITLAMENLQARLRGLELMYLSNDEGVLLLTTGNKSELAMGYCTLYGDMCGGLSVLGDVYKTDVYRLVRYRNALSRVIPDATIKRAPSAELKPNQRDQDSLPPYPVLDQILYLYIEKNRSFAEIVRELRTKHISSKTIKHVLRTVDRNEYKRRQLAPLIRITEKAWFGRRMPITNRFED